MKPHEVLGVAEDATPEQLQAARRRLLFELHPDRHPPARAAEATTAMRMVEEAYDAMLAPKPAGLLERLLQAAGAAVVDQLTTEASSIAQQLQTEASRKLESFSAEELVRRALGLLRGP